MTECRAPSQVRGPGLARQFLSQAARLDPTERLVICGFGRLGQAVARSASSYRPSSQICIVERDHEKAELARKNGYRTVCGDAAQISVQRVAEVGSATAIVICIDPPSTNNIVRTSRTLCPSGHIQVGVSSSDNIAALSAAGADRVISVSALAGLLLAQSL